MVKAVTVTLKENMALILKNWQCVFVDKKKLSGLFKKNRLDRISAFTEKNPKKKKVKSNIFRTRSQQKKIN